MESGSDDAEERPQRRRAERGRGLEQARSRSARTRRRSAARRTAGCRGSRRRTSPSNVNARPWPVQAVHSRPSGLREPMRQQHVKAEHGRRQHERQRDDGLDEKRPAPARNVSQWAIGTPMTSRSTDTRAASRTLSAMAIQSIPQRALRRGRRQEPRGLQDLHDLGLGEKRQEPARRIFAVRRFHHHGGLLDGRIEGRRQSRRTCRWCERRRERERQREQPGLGVARLHELRGLRDVLAEHELGADPVVEPLVPQRRNGRAAVRRMFGVRDGDAPHARVGQDGEAAPEIQPRRACSRTARGVRWRTVGACRLGQARRPPAAAGSRRRRTGTDRRARRSESARRSSRTTRTSA